MGGMGGSESDGGTGGRLRSTILTWLSEKKTEVFVVATANNILGLPPEMTRRGRWDEIWYVGIPTENERKEIWRIHLNLVDQMKNMKEQNLDVLSLRSVDFSGAEIEQTVSDAMFMAYMPGKTVKLTRDLLLSAASEVVPLAKSREADLRIFKEWASCNAKHASVSQSPSIGGSLGNVPGDKEVSLF